MEDAGERFEGGDSGETEGDVSDIDTESSVDIVVVGDSSAEFSELEVEVLPRCW